MAIPKTPEKERRTLVRQYFGQIVAAKLAGESPFVRGPNSAELSTLLMISWQQAGHAVEYVLNEEATGGMTLEDLAEEALEQRRKRRNEEDRDG